MKLHLSHNTRIHQLVMGLVIALVLGLAALASAADDIIVFDDATAVGWQNYSYGTTVNFANTTPVHAGTHSISAAMNGWAGFYMHQNTVIDLTDYQQLSFWVRGNSDCTIRLFLNYDTGINKYFSVMANTWTKVDIPLSELGNPPFLKDIQWMNNSNDNRTIYLDDIKIIAATGSPSAGPALSVNVSADRHAISEDIYGMNFATEELAELVRLPVKRSGGNATSRYNWQNDTSNRGSDWYYENVPEANPNPEALPDGSAVDRFVEQNQQTGTKSLLTAPLLGWVAKRRLTGHPYDCGFKVSKYGPQQKVDSYDPDCGNGITPDGNSFITGNDPTDTSIAIDSSFVSQWISHLTGKYGTAANGGVKYYNLDNEPMLWNGTQRDVHPQPTSYDEIRDRTYQYAAAIKNADPSAQTLGPVVWGWCAYFHSAVDDCYDRTDFQTHNNTHFVPWYLQEMQRYEQEHGVRILDYLDLHIYPQVSGVYDDSVGTTTAQNARMRSIRQLWDESYTHEGWIGQPVYLIPRMKQWIQDNYPGTKSAITEYSWGGLNYLSGALAQADILGVFGREDLELASLWTQISPTSPAAYAFRMYRNYDGEGKGFGETSVQAQSSDQETLSIYAAERSDDAITIMVINKKPKSVVSSLNLSGSTPGSTTEAYRYSSANLNSISRLPNISIVNNSITATFPGNSITLFVLPPDGPVTNFTVTPSAGSNGTISPNTPQTIAQGSPAAFTVSPQAGYAASVGGTCGGTLLGNTYTTNPVIANCTVTATFAQIPHTVTPSAGLHGAISPNTPQTIAHGSTTTFTVTPQAGYAASVSGTCGGSLLGNTYTTNPITANCTVAATFTQITHTVTPSVGPHGTISPNTPQTIAHGSTTTFTVTPQTGYTASVSGTCGGSLQGDIYTTNPITANCTVAAAFIRITHMVISSASDHGTISPEGGQIIEHGNTTAFTVTAEKGFNPSIAGTCGGTLTGTTYTTNPILTDCTVIANFAYAGWSIVPNPLQLTAKVGRDRPGDIIITNIGAQITLGGVADVNDLAAPFGIVKEDCSGQILATNENCTITVVFTPTTNSSFADSFNITIADPISSEETIRLEGRTDSAGLMLFLPAIIHNGQ